MAEAGVDVIFGVDPDLNDGKDMRALKKALNGRVALWGGINGASTIELGAEDDVRTRVREAFDVLAPGGGFILGPVDNVHETTERAMRNVRVLIDTWRELR